MESSNMAKSNCIDNSIDSVESGFHETKTNATPLEVSFRFVPKQLLCQKKTEQQQQEQQLNENSETLYEMQFKRVEKTDECIYQQSLSNDDEYDESGSDNEDCQSSFSDLESVRTEDFSRVFNKYVILNNENLKIHEQQW